MLRIFEDISFEVEDGSLKYKLSHQCKNYYVKTPYSSHKNKFCLV